MTLTIERSSEQGSVLDRAMKGRPAVAELLDHTELGAPYPPPPIKMARFRIDTQAFQEWMRERVLDDREYAMHSLLTEVFGSMQPRPFRMMFNDRMGSDHGAIMGYVRRDGDEFRESLLDFADPLQARILPVDQITVKDMPAQWRGGRTLGFEVRVRPTVSADRKNPIEGLTGERDVFLFLKQQEPGRRTRVEAYAHWLANILRRRDAAVLDTRSVSMASFRVSENRRKLRRGEVGDRLTPEQGRSPDELWHSTRGPDAVLRGQLTVGEPAAFSALLGRGVGRHIAYGYGMLLLRPV